MMGVQTAVYGDDYRAGDAFFIHRHGEFINEGIGYYTDDERKEGDPEVSHVGFVVGPGLGVGAHIQNGLQIENIQEYIRSPDVSIYFKRLKQPNPKDPIDLKKMVDEIMRDEKEGIKYDKKLIFGLWVTRTKLGRYLNKKTNGRFNNYILGKYDNPSLIICSEYFHQKCYDWGFTQEEFDNVSPQFLFSAPYIVDVVKPDMVR